MALFESQTLPKANFVGSSSMLWELNASNVIILRLVWDIEMDNIQGTNFKSHLENASNFSKGYAEISARRHFLESHLPFIFIA
jgi:hypothetical protein